jgi:hypothetical protein
VWQSTPTQATSAAGRSGASATPGEVIDRYSSVVVAAAALFHQAIVQVALRRFNAAIASVQQVIDRYGDDPAPEVRDRPAHRALVARSGLVELRHDLGHRADEIRHGTLGVQVG